MNKETTEESLNLARKANELFASTLTDFRVGDIIEKRYAMPDRLEYSIITAIHVHFYGDSHALAIYGHSCNAQGKIDSSVPVEFQHVAEISQVIKPGLWTKVIGNIKDLK